jgi:hypothetical protein
MISAVVAMIALAVIVQVNMVRPRLRRRRLRWPAEMWFIITKKTQHDCDFAIQDDQEHLVKTIVVQQDREVVIDFKYTHRLDLSISEIIIGCNYGGNVPTPIEYLNRFVVAGDGVKAGYGRHVIPGPGSFHYIDKYGFYHFREVGPSRRWPHGADGSIIQSGSPRSLRR